MAGNRVDGTGSGVFKARVAFPGLRRSTEKLGERPHDYVNTCGHFPGLSNWRVGRV